MLEKIGPNVEVLATYPMPNRRLLCVKHKKIRTTIPENPPKHANNENHESQVINQLEH